MPTAKQNKLIVNLVTKWAHVVAGTYAPNMDKVRKLFDQLYRNQKITKRVSTTRKGKKATVLKRIRLAPPTFVFVQSPMAFMIAQAVMRGRFSKADARLACEAFGIDPGFLAPLRRDKLAHYFSNTRRRWGSERSKLYDAWHETLYKEVRAAAGVAFFDDENAPAAGAPPPGLTFRRERVMQALRTPQAKKLKPRFTALPERLNNETLYQLTNNDLVSVCQKSLVARAPTRSTQFGNFSSSAAALTARHLDAINSLADVPWSGGCDSALFSRWRELGADDPWETSMFDGLLLCALLNAKNNAITQQYDLLQEMPLFMTFRHSVLICLDRPVLTRNADGELHCEDGPAVKWPDGAAQYYIDGHALGALGHRIVNAPEQLTLADINAERNEEVKRIAISRYGWQRYLEETGARVLDRRENWVDNTVEALVQINTQIERLDVYNEVTTSSITQHKMMLACRSTGRQYFLAVPEHIYTCAAAQDWMAAGANIDGSLDNFASVRTLARPPRIVGAS